MAPQAVLVWQRHVRLWHQASAMDDWQCVYRGLARLHSAVKSDEEYNSFVQHALAECVGMCTHGRAQRSLEHEEGDTNERHHEDHSSKAQAPTICEALRESTRY